MVVPQLKILIYLYINVYIKFTHIIGQENKLNKTYKSHEMEYQIKETNILKSLAVLTMICLSCSGCNKEDDMSDSEGAKIKGSVTITSISAQRKTTTGLQINVSIKASGVSTDEVRMLGAVGGTTSDGEGTLWTSLGGGTLSGNAKIVTGLKSKTTYYVKAFLQTTEGTVYSPIKSVTTP